MVKPKGSSVLKKIESRSVKDKVYEELRDAIMRGAIPLGKKVSSRGLAAELGTSDMPVRSALNRLLAEGALVQNSNSTFSVPNINRIKFTEVMTLRAMLEGEAAKQACGHISKKDFQALEASAQSLERAIEANDIAKYLDANQRLKFGIYKSTPSQTLRSMIRLLWLRAAPFLFNLNQGLQQMPEVNFHLEAIQALQDGQAELVGDAISRDILAGMNFLLENGEFGAND